MPCAGHPCEECAFDWAQCCKSTLRIVTFCCVPCELLKFEVLVYMFVKRPDPFPNEVAIAAKCVPPFTNVERRLPCAVRIATFIVSVVRKGNV